MLHRHRLGLVFLIFTVANICVVQLANGDDALIKQVCDGTPVPDACNLCFIQDPDAGKKDAKALADTAIRCSLSHSNIVTEMFVEIRNGTDDPEVRDKCARCEENIIDAMSSLQDAERLWKDGHFSDAANQLAVAVGEVGDCSKLVPGIPSEPIFYDDFTLLKNYYLDAQAIVSKL